VTLLTTDRAQASSLILGRVTRAPFGNMVLKVPFLRSIPLCKNWHLQAIERFAQLSTLTEYPDGHVIFSEGQMVDRFFIIFEGDAIVNRETRQIGVVRVGEFFGEIGLLQNSSASASISARRNLRCLEIPRNEFLRFVTHNYAVALELERVSTARLGRPIFPVRQSDFRVL
jgi:CRP-like cAMP-binding protein